MRYPEPGNVVTVFRSRLDPEHVEEYAAMAAEMLGLAAQMPGFVSFDRFTAEDGERLSVIVFENAETERAWRDHVRHVEAQALGRERFYSEYSIAVSECVRAHHSE